MGQPHYVAKSKVALIAALCILSRLSLCPLQSQTSYLVTQTETSSPPNLFPTLITQTNYPPDSPPIYFQTQTAPATVNGYQFTAWLINGQRAQDFTGAAVNPAPTIFTNNITAVAQYVPVNQYTADQLVPDWYKLFYFGTTNINASNNPSGDGFNIGVDFFRGYDPLLFNQVIEGGISRRRSPTTLVIVNTNLVQVSAMSQPFGLYSATVQVLPIGTNYSLPAVPSVGGYGFIGWFVGTNRVDNPNGFSSGTLNFTISSNTTFVAEFLPSGQDSDGDGIPDWYEMYYFNSLANTPASNPSGDGFNIATDILRGYQPNVFNQVIEGGISRRRSATTLVIVNTNLVQVSATSQPFGLYSAPVQVLAIGTNYSLPAAPSVGGYGFIGWFVGTNRVDNPEGFSSGTLNITISSNTTFVAEFLPSGQDSDVDGIPDWYEMYYFNSLTNTPASNPSGDGFNIATDILRGYQPNVFNQVIEGGISRRRSPVLAFVPAPPGVTAPPQSETVPPGTNITLTVQPQGIGPFTYQWLLNGVPIPGATNQSYTLSNVQPTNGGSFSVRVFNAFGWIVSDPGVAQVECADLALSDDFYGAPLYFTNGFVGSGNNSSATEQPGEPAYEAKEGGQHSVWTAWQATEPGIITFDTLGSSFDTVLAVYTNASGTPVNITNLTLVAADDDSGGFLTSEVQFNTTVGQTYYVAVDGFEGASGNIVLSWLFTPTNAQLPLITSQPLSFVAGVGYTVAFAVGATGSSTLSYQWLVDGVLIPGGTNSTLTLSNIQNTDVGNYAVLVSNGSETVESLPAFLQINSTDGSVQQAEAIDKLGNTVPLGTPSAPNLVHALDDGLGSAPARGFTGTQVFSTVTTPTSAQWFSILAPTNGPMLVTTEGSEFATLCTIFTGPANAISTNQLSSVEASTGTGYDKLTSRMSCTAISNQTYYVETQGAKNQSGHVTLTWAFGFQNVIQSSIGSPGLSTATLNVQITNAAPQKVQWYFDQTAIPGATNLTLALGDVNASQQGVYGVTLINTNGTTRRDDVFLQVNTIALSAHILASNNTVRLQFGKTFGLPVQVQASSNMVNWVSIYTNNSPGTNNSFIDPTPAGQKQRYYRIYIP